MSFKNRLICRLIVDRNGVAAARGTGKTVGLGIFAGQGKPIYRARFMLPHVTASFEAASTA